MSRRHRARRLTLQALCCIDVQGRHVVELIDEFIDDSGEPAETISDAHDMFNRTLVDRELADELLAKHARHWELSRLALVDRNILRMGVSELRHGEPDLRVVISEAMKLAQEFSSAESPRFINGVLDAVATELNSKHSPSQLPIDDFSGSQADGDIS